MKDLGIDGGFEAIVTLSLYVSLAHMEILFQLDWFHITNLVVFYVLTILYISVRLLAIMLERGFSWLVAMYLSTYVRNYVSM